MLSIVRTFRIVFAVNAYRYLRASTVDQVYGIEAQRAEIQSAYPEAVFYEEPASGKAGSNRPQFEAVGVGASVDRFHILPDATRT